MQCSHECLVCFSLSYFYPGMLLLNEAENLSFAHIEMIFPVRQGQLFGYTDNILEFYHVLLYTQYR